MVTLTEKEVIILEEINKNFNSNYNNKSSIYITANRILDKISIITQTSKRDISRKLRLLEDKKIISLKHIKGNGHLVYKGGKYDEYIFNILSK